MPIYTSGTCIPLLKGSMYLLYLVRDSVIVKNIRGLDFRCLKYLLQMNPNERSE